MYRSFQTVSLGTSVNKLTMPYSNPFTKVDEPKIARLEDTHVLVFLLC